MATPTATTLTLPDAPRLAALDGERLYVAAWRNNALDPIGDADAAGLTSIAPCADPPGWYAGGARDLFRRSINGGGWLPVAAFHDPIQQLMPAPDGSSELVILTGTPAEPVLDNGRVWRLSAGGEPRRIAAVQDGYRPWRLWPAHRDGRPQLAAATYKRTRFMPFQHNCLFLFGWAAKVTPTWLGSALSRPYLDACHADLRHDGTWRLIAVEQTAEGQPSLGVYVPIGFGYSGEWRSDSLDGMDRVKAFGDAVIVGGSDRWSRLLPDGDGYRLVRLEGNAAGLDGVTRAGDNLVGHVAGQWLTVALHAAAPEPVRGEE